MAHTAYNGPSDRQANVEPAAPPRTFEPGPGHTLEAERPDLRWRLSDGLAAGSSTSTEEIVAEIEALERAEGLAAGARRSLGELVFRDERCEAALDMPDWVVVRLREALGVNLTEAHAKARRARRMLARWISFANERQRHLLDEKDAA